MAEVAWLLPPLSDELIMVRLPAHAMPPATAALFSAAHKLETCALLMLENCAVAKAAVQLA